MYEGHMLISLHKPLTQL